MPYGINNNTGMPGRDQAFMILKKANSVGINLLDSAEAYGEAIDVIGHYLKENRDAPFRVISKFTGGKMSLEQRVTTTLDKLGRDRLYCYMYHRFSDYSSGAYKRNLTLLKKQGKIEHIGVSLYSTDELQHCLQDEEISIVQIPYNPFDASKEKQQLLERAKEYGKEIHVRSVFLQGLFFKKSHELTGNLTPLASPLSEFHELVTRYDVDVRTACLNYALYSPFIDSVVIGVETVDQLDENMAAINEVIPRELFSSLESIVVGDDQLVNPSNWKP